VVWSQQACNSRIIKDPNKSIFYTPTSILLQKYKSQKPKEQENMERHQTVIQNGNGALNHTSGMRPKTPETNTRLLDLIAWEYGPNAAGALSVLTASFLATIKAYICHRQPSKPQNRIPK